MVKVSLPHVVQSGHEYTKIMSVIASFSFVFLRLCDVKLLRHIIIDAAACGGGEFAGRAHKSGPLCLSQGGARILVNIPGDKAVDEARVEVVPGTDGGNGLGLFDFENHVSAM